MPENNRGIIKKEKHKTNPTINRTNHLLIIGIDSYKNGIPSLNNAVRDAQNFKELLLQQYQFSTENITYLFNEKATSINIRRTFSKILKKLTDNDNLIFYYSGHGEQLPYGKEKRGYWIPYDAELGEDYTYIPNEEITLLFKNSRAHHVFGIVDSCFSGSLFQNRSLSKATERVNSFPSRWLLTAGRLEPVSDGSLGANSPFSTALLTYLKNNNSDDLWVADLCNQVLKGMNFNAEKQTPRGEALQGVGHYGGQFVFYKKGVTPTIISPPKQTTESVTPTQTVQITNPFATPTIDASELIALKKQLKKLVQRDLGRAIDEYQKHLRKGASQEDDLIMLMSNFKQTKKDQRMGILTHDEETRSFNKIRHSYLEYVNELTLEDTTLETTTSSNNLEYQSTKGGNISFDLQQLEQSGLKTQAELIIKKINRIKEGLILETDVARQFQYENMIEKMEQELQDIKAKLQG